MTVVAIRIMIANNFLPVVLAGTGFITVTILIRCLTVHGPLYVALAAMAVMTAVFFIQLSRRLEETARDILAYRSQREKLIAELERARDQAERDRKRAEEERAGQVAVPRYHEPRAQDAAQRHHGFFGDPQP